MITLSKKDRNHKLQYVVASGALAYDGLGYPHEKYFWRYFPRVFDPSLFTVVTKTLTYGQRKGNFKMYWPWGCIRPVSKDGQWGFVNAVGLTNPGLFWWCEEIGPTVDRKKIPIVVSIRADEKAHLLEMIDWLEPSDIVGIELNESCPNVKEGISQNAERIAEKCRLVYEKSRHPLILKLSVLHNVKALIPLIKDYVDAISINSVPWEIVFPGVANPLGDIIVPGRKSPLAHLGGGGVSGQLVQKYTWTFAGRVIDMKVPVICPSIWKFSDMQKVSEMIGADAISFGSLFLRNCCLPTMYVRREIEAIHRV